MTGLKLDWRRFVSEQMSDFTAGEIRAVRSESELPATTNFMYFFKGLDYHRLRDELDVISWDNYPFWHKKKDEVTTAMRTAASHSLMRSMKRQPFLLMESTPAMVSWRTVNPVKRPGMHMLSLYAGSCPRIGFCAVFPVEEKAADPLRNSTALWSDTKTEPIPGLSGRLPRRASGWNRWRSFWIIR